MKTKIKINESLLKKVIKECVSKIINENVCDIDDLILFAKNNEEIYERLTWLANAIRKKMNRGIEIDKNILINCSVMKKIQQFAVREYTKNFCSIGYKFTPDQKLKLRTELAEKVLDMIYY